MIKADSTFIWTKSFTLFVKGIGIFLIVAHNFFHWVKPNTGENEMSFNLQVVRNLFDNYHNFPFEFINTTFDFFGHFGVQLFIFISGIGLTIAYGSKKTSSFVFIAGRGAKIFLSLVLAIVFLLIVYKVHGKEINEALFRDLYPFLLFIQNYIPGKLFIINGPWWFYSLIVQLYLVFPLLYWLIKKYDLKGLLGISGVSYVLIYVLQQFFRDHQLFIFSTFTGHLPEFSLAIYLALGNRISVPNILFFISLLIFALANIVEVFYPFQFISITYILIYILQSIYTQQVLSVNMLYKAAEQLGVISMAVFAVNGFLREPLYQIADSHEHALLTIGLFCVYFVLVLLVSLFYHFIFNQLVKLLKLY